MASFSFIMMFYSYLLFFVKSCINIKPMMIAVFFVFFYRTGDISWLIDKGLQWESSSLYFGAVWCQCCWFGTLHAGWVAEESPAHLHSVKPSNMWHEAVTWNPKTPNTELWIHLNLIINRAALERESGWVSEADVFPACARSNYLYTVFVKWQWIIFFFVCFVHATL